MHSHPFCLALKKNHTIDRFNLTYNNYFNLTAVAFIKMFIIKESNCFASVSCFILLLLIDYYLLAIHINHRHQLVFRFSYICSGDTSITCTRGLLIFKQHQRKVAAL